MDIKKGTIDLKSEQYHWNFELELHIEEFSLMKRLEMLKYSKQDFIDNCQYLQYKLIDYINNYNPYNIVKEINIMNLEINEEKQQQQKQHMELEGEEDCDKKIIIYPIDELNLPLYDTP